ncbi:hypothetical protein H4R34_001003 [Dimargaris verticillata]|uniref:Uncharacterized protein n=1 Tax=Dimargaris verticillata TaxID=2761393 RepID=A0A9W8BAS0_9FUNG|nr:hypothetical protein H4R34_001003 [Dimargaris verticillata]
MSVSTYDPNYAIALRFHGSVLPRVAPSVIMFAAWATAVQCVDKYTVLSIGIDTTVITILSMVLSLLLVFRTNTAYDRYWEGRRVWSEMVVAIRNLARLMWVVIPNDLDGEKDLVVHLLHAFAISVKCYLQGTDAFEEIHHIEVIRPVIPALKEYYNAIRSEGSLPNGWSRDPSFLNAAEPTLAPSLSETPDNTLGPARESSRGDITVVEPLAAVRLRDDSAETKLGHDNGSDSRQSSKATLTKSRRRRHLSIPQMVRKTLRHGNMTAEDIQAENATVPYVISLFLSNYVAHVRAEETIDAIHFGQCLAAINTLTTCLTGFERIQKTPIPVAYAIHLHQALLLYLIVLPFQCIRLLDWATIPVVAIAAFTMLGILDIGKEIENPFGNDANDLPLDDFCKVIGHEMNDITTYSSPNVEDWVRHTDEACSHSHSHDHGYHDEKRD